MRFGRPMVAVWLLIGILAAGQRHYFTRFDGSCGRIATIGVNIVSGPLNYVGLNPWVSCRAPQPSR